LRISSLASADPGKKYAQRIENGQKCVKILGLYALKGNDRRRGLLLRGKTRKTRDEFIRIAAEEITMDAIQNTIDLYHRPKS
jgi:hypothetical protein